MTSARQTEAAGGVGQRRRNHGMSPSRAARFAPASACLPPPGSDSRTGRIPALRSPRRANVSVPAPRTKPAPRRRPDPLGPCNAVRASARGRNDPARIDERIGAALASTSPRGGLAPNRSIASPLAKRSSLAGSGKETRVTELPSTSYTHREVLAGEMSSSVASTRRSWPSRGRSMSRCGPNVTGRP